MSHKLKKMGVMFLFIMVCLNGYKFARNHNTYSLNTAASLEQVQATQTNSIMCNGNIVTRISHKMHVCVHPHHRKHNKSQDDSSDGHHGGKNCSHGGKGHGHHGGQSTSSDDSSDDDDSGDHWGNSTSSDDSSDDDDSGDNGHRRFTGTATYDLPTGSPNQPSTRPVSGWSNPLGTLKAKGRGPNIFVTWVCKGITGFEIFGSDGNPAVGSDKLRIHINGEPDVDSSITEILLASVKDNGAGSPPSVVPDIAPANGVIETHLPMEFELEKYSYNPGPHHEVIHWTLVFNTDESRSHDTYVTFSVTKKGDCSDGGKNCSHGGNGHGPPKPKKCSHGGKGHGHHGGKICSRSHFGKGHGSHKHDDCFHDEKDHGPPKPKKCSHGGKGHGHHGGKICSRSHGGVGHGSHKHDDCSHDEKRPLSPWSSWR